MNCPNCKNEMIKGVLTGAVWYSGEPQIGTKWPVKVLRFNLWPQNKEINFVSAWKCSKCGKIELQAEQKEK